MFTFASILMVGAVAGWAMEQQWGQQIVRWSRQHRMRMRVLRRQGVNPLRALIDPE